MTRPYPIHCIDCQGETGAWFAGGDPYLPCIYCTACAEKSNTESESGTDSCERSEQMTE